MKHFTAAVITVSDKGYRGERVDSSGPALCALLKEQGYEIAYTSMVPDEAEQIRAELLKCADEKKLSLVLTTGGTGFSTRDITPEATKAVLERETPGIPELMRAESMKITPRGCLSRSVAGIRGRKKPRRKISVRCSSRWSTALKCLTPKARLIVRILLQRRRQNDKKNTPFDGRVAERSESRRKGFSMRDVSGA